MPHEKYNNNGYEKKVYLSIHVHAKRLAQPWFRTAPRIDSDTPYSSFRWRSLVISALEPWTRATLCRVKVTVLQMRGENWGTTAVRCTE